MVSSKHVEECKLPQNPIEISCEHSPSSWPKLRAAQRGASFPPREICRVMLRTATALALSAGGCMAFVTPSDVHSKAITAPSGSLRASATGGARQGGNLLNMAGTAVAVSALGVAMKRLNRHGSESSMPRQVVGVCLPLSEKFDPLELSSTDAKMERYTQVEIKHGRVAMIATMGYIMPEIFRFPGCEAFNHGLGALESIPLEGWVQLFALVGAHEVLVKPREGGLGPSDFGLGTELLDGIDDEELERKQTSERNNGRLAMIAIMGLMVQDGMFGEPPLTYMSLSL